MPWPNNHAHIARTGFRTVRNAAERASEIARTAQVMEQPVVARGARTAEKTGDDPDSIRAAGVTENGTNHVSTVTANASTKFL